MNAIDTGMQPQDDRRRQHRHFEAVPANGYPPVSGTGEFSMSNAQGAFTFSAEPTGMAFETSIMGASNQDCAFVPNVGSSALHPDMVNRPPYYQHDAYNQGQNLSPGTYTNIGQARSPSHSTDHLSPEPGYASDFNQHDLSNYTTPSYNGQYLDESFSNLNFADDSGTTTFPPYQADVDMSLLTSGTLNTYNAQTHMSTANGAFPQPHNQMLSPSNTNASSPAVGNDATSFSTLRFIGEDQSSFMPPKPAIRTRHTIPRKPLQSPPLTNSPGYMSLASPRPLTRHMTSPIVRVENYSSREESPSHSDNSRGMSKRSLNGRRSSNHLSPYPADERSDEEDLHESSLAHPSYGGAERNEDGAWLVSGGQGQAGLSPGDRRAMGNMMVPSLDDIAERRAKLEKKLEVQNWLTKSELNSEAEDAGSPSSYLKPNVGRRRAKSQNDANRLTIQDGFGNHSLTALDKFSPRYINENSDYDDDEDGDDFDSDSPPASVNMRIDRIEESYFPETGEHSPATDAIVQPWMDVLVQMPITTHHYQPPTSNAAMMRFRQRAKDVESASLAATVGSRRLSEPDLGSIRGAPGVARIVEPETRKSDDRQRRPSFLRSMRRSPSNVLKRKGSMPVQQSSDTGTDQTKDPTFEKPSRIGSWGRPKSPRVNTNLSDKSKEGAASGPLGVGASSWTQGPKKLIKRSRSRSDIGRSRGDAGKSLGLAELMTQHGGPPMPRLASPLADTEATKQSAQPSSALDDDDDDQDPITMDLKVRTDPIIPNQEGYRTHARQLNPRLADFMVERIAQEQIRRYKRLLEFRVKHLNVVQNGNCPSGKFCTELGGEAKQLQPKAGSKDPDAPFIGFQITVPGEEDDGDLAPEGTVVAAQFPSGVPLPPVKRLPAEFECPLCFKVKKFYKPSDWTKHVHEDVQPFTCTFPNCQEPKSFKRKADWVRHENERHRQLENWTCNITDCNHTCFRKDNFVQHLVREHKIAEPKQRTARGSNKDPSSSGDSGMHYDD